MLAISMAGLLFITGCRFGTDENSLVISGDFPLVYVKRPRNVNIDPTRPITYNEGSDLFLRDISSPDSEEINITKELTLGQGDVADPEVSFDGKTIVFSMKCSSSSASICNLDETWNIWLYDIQNQSFKRVIFNFQTANAGDDVDPAFLPGNKIVFSSNRQLTTLEKTQSRYRIKESDEFANNLHTINLDGTKLEQITVSHTHDRNPTVLSNGKIMFSRWLYDAERNQMAIYSANPDGTDLNVLYGAHSPGDVFLHPRELENGKVISTVLPIDGTWESGALMTLDVQNYSDANVSVPNVLNKGQSGQQYSTIQEIPLEKIVSRLGRFTTPYPLLDGSNQILVSYSFMQTLDVGVDAFERLNSIDEVEAPPAFGIFMLNSEDKSLQPLILPEKDVALVEAVAAFPRKEPPIILRNITYNPGVFNLDQAEGIINIKSVYDTDQFARLGQNVLTAKENAAIPFPLIPSNDLSSEAETFIADISILKDPLQTVANKRPARFIRVSKSLPTPIGFTQQAVGETDFKMQELVGYAPIEPDGSIKIKVPADVPIRLSVLDENGRSLGDKSNWLQVRPGETLTCNGCHSSTKTPPLNSSPIAGNHPNTALKSSVGRLLNASPDIDETMAETRTRVDEITLELSKDLIYVDVWTDEQLRPKDPSIDLRYRNLDTLAPSTGVINYPEHIQPIWDKERNGGACISCHNGVEDEIINPTDLNLIGIAGFNRMDSYDNLLQGQDILDENGRPIFEEFTDKTTKKKQTSPLVNAGYARGSYITEILFGQELFAEKPLNTTSVNHASMLTAVERKLIVEWIDLGAQYYNDPYDANGELIVIKQANNNGKFSSLFLELTDLCNGCHSVRLQDGRLNPNYVNSSYVLNMDQNEDYIASLRKTSYVNSPDESEILARPSGIRDNEHGSGSTAILPVSSRLYQAVREWVIDEH